MNYRLEWMRSASDELESLLATSEPALYEAIASAIDEIERRLSTRPFTEGESREGHDRIAFFPPLAVEYFIIPKADIVTVFHVSLYGKTE